MHPNAVGPRISKIIFGTLREVVKKKNNKEAPGVGSAVGSGGWDAYYREGNRELFIIATKCSWSAHMQNHFWTLREVVKKTNNKETPGVGSAVGSGGQDAYYREGNFL